MRNLDWEAILEVLAGSFVSKFLVLSVENTDPVTETPVTPWNEREHEGSQDRFIL